MRLTPETHLEDRYPRIEDLRLKAHRRLPRFVRTYLDAGTGDDIGVLRNRKQFEDITLVPRVMTGVKEPDISTTIFGTRFDAPFGIAPIGLGGMIWPQAENILARSAASHRIPYCLSTVAAETPEQIGSLAGDMGWFQLYPPRHNTLLDDLLGRVKDAGFHTLILTVDVPLASRRETLRRAGMRLPPRITPGFVWQAARYPEWAFATLTTGIPRFKTIEKYAESTSLSELSSYLRENIGGPLDWSYLAKVRQRWSGSLIIKGLLHPDDVHKAIQHGVDGVVVSNHGARQFNGAPAAIDVLPVLSNLFKDKATIIFDSGVRSGLDVLRAIASGADLVLLGRAFMYGVAALGSRGGDHVVDLLVDDIKNNMIQLGIDRLEDVKTCLYRPNQGQR